MKKAMLVAVLLSCCSGCASILAGNFRSEVNDCMARYESGSEEREVCVETAREIYAQKSQNLRHAAHIMSGR
jgi:outer membrane lipoprotein-sorting protein